MKKFLVCLAAMLCVFICSVAVSAADVPSEAEVYSKITAMKSQYPEGRSWTNGNYATWKGGKYGASGCMGFAFIMSDAAFGSLPARDIYPSGGKKISISDLRVGDILRLPGHSVVVLETHSDHIIITEGNYQRRVHWGRRISAAQVARARYYTTRYPIGYTGEPTVKPVPITCGGQTYQVTDIGEHWATEYITSCVSSGILSLSGDTSCAYFGPSNTVTRAQAVTALYRLAGSPAPRRDALFSDIIEDWYRDSVSWAVDEGIVSGITEDTFEPYAPITREQLALMMYRYSCSSESEADLSVFPDAGKVSPFAESGVSWAVKSGIISGKEGLLLPKGEMTKAEFCATIVRLRSTIA